MQTLALTWRRLPGKSSLFLSRQSTPSSFRNLAERIYSSKRTFLDSRERDIAEIFEQFKSYSPGSDEFGQGLVSVRRMLYWMRRLNPAQLNAFNVYFVQKALGWHMKTENAHERS